MRLGHITGFIIVGAIFVVASSLALSGLHYAVESLMAAGNSKYLSFAFVGAGVATMVGAFAMWISNDIGERVEPERWGYIVQFENGDAFAFVPVVHKSPKLQAYMAIEMAERTMDLQGNTKVFTGTEPLVHGPYPMFMEHTL